MKILCKVLAEIILSVVAFLLLWSAAGRLLTSASDVNVLAGVLLLILTLCLMVFAARTIYSHVKEIINHGLKNQ